MEKKFSLVLSGGSALGFAHLGAIKYLEEQNQFPSEVLGTSMGSLIGAVYAYSLDYEYCYEIFKETQYLKLIKPEFFHSESLISIENIKEYLYKIFGDKKLKDMKIPLKLVATNSKTGKSKAFEENTKVVDALCASISYPGVFPNYKINKEYYLDGFLSSNLPFEYAKFNPLCINVINQYLIDKEQFESPIKSLRQTIITLINNQKNIKQDLIDKDVKIIDLDLSKYSIIDFSKLDEILEDGYKQTKKYLD